MALGYEFFLSEDMVDVFDILGVDTLDVEFGPSEGTYCLFFAPESAAAEAVEQELESPYDPEDKTDMSPP